MKKFNLFVMAALSATYSLTSCSSDDEIDSEPMNVEQAAQSASFLSVNLHLADMTSTRALQFDDGKGWEYALNSAALYIYKKVSVDGETKYQLVCKSELSSEEIKKNTESEVITGSEPITATLDGFEPNGDEQYYVLVLANRPKACPDPEESLYFDDWMNKPWNECDAIKTYEDNQLSSTESKAGLFMTNALLVDDATKSADEDEVNFADPTYILTAVNASDFKTTKEEAEAETNDGVNVYIERSCAKLTVAENESGEQYWGETGGELTTTSFYAGRVQLLDFGAHNYNTVSFPVHTLTVDDTYGISKIDKKRMKESAYFYNKVATIGGMDYYSVNWSYTPRYNQHTALTVTTMLPEIGSTSDEGTKYTWDYLMESGSLYKQDNGVIECYGLPYTFTENKGVDYIAYVPENCQEFSGMHKGETTAVILRGQWTPSKDEFSKGMDVYVCNGRLYTEAQLKQTILDACKEAGCEYTEDDTHKIDLTGLNAKNIKNQSGVEALTTDEIGKATDDQLKAINAALNTSADGGILMYEGGICYYVVYPRHFDNEDVNTGYEPNKSSYKLADLGRYGLVRNHWYQLNVSSIALPGTPYVPEITTHDPEDNPDDFNPNEDDPGKKDNGDDDIDEEVDNTGLYLSVNIKELSWTKRTNSLKF